LVAESDVLVELKKELDDVELLQVLREVVEKVEDAADDQDDDVLRLAVVRDEQVQQNGVDDVDFDVFEDIEKDLVDLLGDLGY